MHSSELTPYLNNRQTDEQVLYFFQEKLTREYPFCGEFPKNQQQVHGVSSTGRLTALLQ